MVIRCSKACWDVSHSWLAAWNPRYEGVGAGSGCQRSQLQVSSIIISPDGNLWETYRIYFLLKLSLRSPEKA